MTRLSLEKELERVKGWAATAGFHEAWSHIEKLPLPQIPDGSDPHAAGLQHALHLRSLAAEICDYLGKLDRARELVETPGRYCEAELRSLLSRAEIPENERDLILQRVWIVLQAGMCEYRAAKFDSALSLFKLCDQIAPRFLLGAERKQRFGTRARILYLIGITYREQYKLKRSVRYLTASTELASRSFVANTDKEGRQVSLLVPLAIARSIGMGLASVHNTLGRPDLAVPLLMTAKAMLPPREKIISTHIDMLSASLPPWSYRQDGEEHFVNEKLSRTPALDALSKCHDHFRAQGHRLYQTRAAYYLAKELIRCSDEARRERSLPRQQEFLSRAEQLFGELDYPVSGDRRFALSLLALQSEIAVRKEQFEEAERRAALGLAEASAAVFPDVYLDLLLARGAARLGRRHYEGAIADWKEGFHVASEASNHALAAAFLLRLTQACLKNDAYGDATETFNEFLEIKQFLEVETVDQLVLEHETRALLEKHETDDYVLRLKENLDPQEEQKQFRRALVRWARSKTSTDAAAAKLLKVTRQTLYNWQK